MLFDVHATETANARRTYGWRVLPYCDPEEPTVDKPRWSPNGKLLYHTSESDGFRCIYAQKLNTGKSPVEERFDVLSHAQRTAIHVSDSFGRPGAFDSQRPDGVHAEGKAVANALQQTALLTERAVQPPEQLAARYPELRQLTADRE